MKRIYLILILVTMLLTKLMQNVNNPFYNAIDNKSFGLIESLIASGENINTRSVR